MNISPEKRLLVAQKFTEITDEGRRLRLMLFDRYADMAEASEDVNKKSLIRGNKKTFNLIIDENIVSMALMLRGYGYEEYEKVASARPELANMLKSEARARLIVENISKECGLKPSGVSVQTIIEGFQSYDPSRQIPEPMDNLDVLEDETDIVIENETGVGGVKSPDFEFVDEDDDFEEDSDFEEESFEDEDEDEDGDEKIDLEELLEKKEEGSAKVVKAESIEADDDFISEENPELTASVNRVMAIYKDLFEVGFELNKPAGVIVKEGMLKLRGNSTVLMKSGSLAEVYSIINDICGSYLVQSEIKSAKSSEKLREISIRKGTTYYPEFQLGTMLGKIGNNSLESWDGVLELIRKEVHANIKKTFDDGGDEDVIIGALTTAIVVSELDPNKVFKFRFYVGDGSANAGKFEREYNGRKQKIFKGGGKLYLIHQLSSGVIEVTMVFNMKSYQTAPLFAYKAVELLKDRGKTLGIREMIVGQDTSGRIKTMNLDSQGASIMLLAAGPRSGKGVLTLNLVGTILASKCPLVYLDCKPDMASVFWDVAKKHGIKAAVWDGDTATGFGVGRNAPQECLDKFPGLMTKLPYLKVVQLMLVQTHLMVAGKFKCTNRPFYIFDEIMAFQDSLRPSWDYMIQFAGKKDKDKEEINEWADAIKGWGNGLSGELSGTINSQLPMSGLSTVWLFQSMQQSLWKSKETKDKFNPFYDLVNSRLSTKFLGRATYDSQNALLKVKDEKDIKTMIENRHFAISNSQRINSRDDIEVFKPYLVLNSAENDASCVKELKSNVEAVTPGTWDYLTNGTGNLHSGAGFEGFANIIGEGAIANLGLGYEMLWELMGATGLADLYDSVEDYIFDADADSFYSLAALKRGVGGTSRNDSDDEEAGYGNESYSVDFDYEDDDDEETVYAGGGNLGATAGTAGLAGMAGASLSGATAMAGATSGAGLGMRVKTMDLVDDTMLKENEALESYENYSEDIVEVELGEDEGVDGEQLDFSDLDIDENMTDPRVLEDIRQISAINGVGKGGRRIVLDSNNITGPAALLNKENSIDCRKASVGELTPFEELMLSTPKGAARYTKKLWGSILSQITSSGLRAPNVTRLSIYGGHMYINGNIVNLNGVIGGKENIRVVDIVDFKATFKKFPRIRDLRLDEQMLNAAILELGDDVINRIFTMNKNLGKLYISSSDGYTKVISAGDFRESYMQNKIEDMRFRNNVDTYCRNKTNKGWSNGNIGDNIWGMKVAKSTMSNAGKALMDSNKPRVGTALVYAGASIVAGTVGFVGYSIVKGIGGLRGILRLTR